MCDLTLIADVSLRSAILVAQVYVCLFCSTRIRHSHRRLYAVGTFTDRTAVGTCSLSPVVIRKSLICARVPSSATSKGLRLLLVDISRLLTHSTYSRPTSDAICEEGESSTYPFSKALRREMLRPTQLAADHAPLDSTTSPSSHTCLSIDDR